MTHSIPAAAGSQHARRRCLVVRPSVLSMIQRRGDEDPADRVSTCDDLHDERQDLVRPAEQASGVATMGRLGCRICGGTKRD